MSDHSLSLQVEPFSTRTQHITDDSSREDAHAQQDYPLSLALLQEGVRQVHIGILHDVDELDLPVLHVGDEVLAADLSRNAQHVGHVSLQSEVLGQLARSIGEEAHLAFEVRTGLLPRMHDKWIVRGDTDDLIDALLLVLLVITNESGQLSLRAVGNERAPDAEENDLLVGQELLHLHLVVRSILEERDVAWERRQSMGGDKGEGTDLGCGIRPEPGETAGTAELAGKTWTLLMRSDDQRERESVGESEIDRRRSIVATSTLDDGI